MVKHSPHKRWKGHCLACRPHKVKGASPVDRMPFRELRKLGRKRRLRRGDLGELD